jgi:hypothetical protein
MTIVVVVVVDVSLFHELDVPLIVVVNPVDSSLLVLVLVVLMEVYYFLKMLPLH